MLSSQKLFSQFKLILSFSEWPLEVFRRTLHIIQKFDALLIICYLLSSASQLRDQCQKEKWLLYGGVLLKYRRCSGLAAVPSLGFKSFFDVVKYDSIPRFIVPTVQYVSETYKQLMDEFCI